MTNTKSQRNIYISLGFIFNNFRMYCISKIKNILSGSSVVNRIARGAFWSMFGTSIAKFILLFSSIICANILGREGFGELGLIRSTINMFVVFGTVGLGVTASKYISQYKATEKEKVSKIYYLTFLFSVISGLIISIVILFGAPFIANNTLDAPELIPQIRLGAFLLFVTVINASLHGILSGFEDFKSIAINTFISSLIESFAIILGAYYWGVNGAVLGYGLGILSLLLCNKYKISTNFKRYNIQKRFTSINKDDISILFTFSLPAALSSFLVAPTYWIVRTMLIRFSGFAELGIYEAADQWKMVILFIPSALSQIILPILSSELTERSKKNYWYALKINLFINMIVSFIIATIISCCSSYIMQSYGEGFNNYFPLIVLAYSTVFSSFASVVGVSIVSRGKMWLSLFFNLIWSVLFISLTYIFLYHNYGALGISLALLLSYLIHSLYQSLYLVYIYKKEN